MAATVAPPSTAIVVLRRDSGTNEPIERVGGKGSALHGLIRAGLPVPRAAVVSTGAYERAVAESRDLAALLASCPDDDAAVDAAFAGVIDPGLRREIVAARRLIAPDGPVVVRSSATTEDLGGASFAGQYRSVIGVEEDDDVVAAVEQVWASLWHVAPRTYRHLHGLDSARVAMAAIVQPLVPSATAGVVFTVDPSCASMLRVERVAGQGEGLVSGELIPEVFLLDRATLRPSPDEDAGVDSDVVEAARSALLAECEFGAPQDVEWAHDGATTWVVQSRPITTTAPRLDDDGFDTAVRADRRYTTAGIAEMLPGVLPPLQWSTIGFMVDHAFNEVMDRLGGLAPEDVDGRFVVRVRGRAALDLDRLATVAQRLPGGSPDEIERQFFGTSSGVEDAAGPAPRRWARARHDMRVVSANRRARSEQAIVDHAVRAVLDEGPDLAAMAPPELVARRARLVDLGVRATVAEFAVAAAAVASFGRLEGRLIGYLGPDEGARRALRVTRGLRTETVLDDVGLLARELADAVPGALDVAEWEPARDRIVRAGRPDLAASVVAATDRAGSRRLAGGPSWSEDPDSFWRLVRGSAAVAANGPDPHRDLDELVAVLASSPGWQRRRWLTGQLIDSRLLIVRRLARDAVDLLGRRETAKSSLLALGGRIRAVDLEVGRRLVERGALLHALDVDQLTPGEIARSVEGRGDVPLDTVLARRRCAERWRSESDLPQVFEGRPTAAQRPVPTGDLLRGWSASGGRHTGPVRCLDAPDADSVQPGDVVVARRTDASWSPVFLRAAAVVVEEGGPLSHAAIVARELGLPAVVNVPGAVERLRAERRSITVDGDAGTVHVGDDGPGDDGAGDDGREVDGGSVVT